MNTPLRRFKSCIASQKVWQQWLPNLPQYLLQDAFLAYKLNINNEWKKKVKIKNLKEAKNLGVMIEEKFKLKVAIRRWKDLDAGYKFGLDLIAIRRRSREL